MAMLVAPFQAFSLVLERLRNCGCEVRKTKGNLTGPYGETIEVWYAYNPLNQEFVYLDYAPDDTLEASAIDNIERRLRVSLGFPKNANYDESASKAVH